MQIRASDQKTLLWKNKKPNSNRHTKILRSQWIAETSDFILQSHESIEAEIAKLEPLVLKVNDVNITVNFVVKNCMNDGKVVHAVATKYYKSEKLIPESAKSISFHACHLCGRTQKEFQTHFHVQKATLNALIPLGMAPLHCAKNSRENILKSAFRKHAEITSGKKDTKSVKNSQNMICEKLRQETGARLFEPEPEKKGIQTQGPI